MASRICALRAMHPRNEPSRNPPAPTETVRGTIDRISFHAEDSGYCILRVKPSEDSKMAGFLTVVGHAGQISEGLPIEATGEWFQHPQFGRQFKAVHIVLLPPQTARAIELLLASGIIKGIGAAYAKKLVEHFGDQTLEVIEKTPERLREVSGLGRTRAEQLRDAWKEHRSLGEILLFLQSHGIATARATRIFKVFGKDAIARITQDPYILSREIHGFGFASADRIALKLGLSVSSPERLQAAVLHVLDVAQMEGHTALPRERVEQELRALLGVAVATEDLARATDALIQANRLVEVTIEGTPCFARYELFECETRIAERIQEVLITGAPRTLMGEDASLPRCAPGVELTQEQSGAVQMALTSKLCVITGGPGTGKTTIIRAIVGAVENRAAPLALCAPTGRAAKRMSDCTGRPAKTLHRYLRIDPISGHSQNEITDEVIVIDESSMIDVLLMRALLDAVPSSSRLVFVGDIDQLPSVGPGAVLRSLLESGVIPVARLTQVFRQAAQSQIIRAAHAVKEGRLPHNETQPDGQAESQTDPGAASSSERRSALSDFFMVQSRDPESIVAKVIDLIKIRIPAKFGIQTLEEIQVITPMNRGPLGTRALNERLQAAFNPDPPAAVERFGTRYGVGDRIMITENDYDLDVYNGDMGWVRSIDREAQMLYAEIDGRSVRLGFDQLSICQLAYATTVHKAQGSEFAAVILVMTMAHFPMLRGDLLYTALTRGKRCVVLLGETRALEQCIARRERTRRWVTFNLGI